VGLFAGRGAASLSLRRTLDRSRSLWVVGPTRIQRFRQISASVERLPPLALTPSRRLPFEGRPVRFAPFAPREPKLTKVSGSSLGVPQRSPLHRHHRARPLSVARGSGLPHPNTFHPCRSSRLRWLAPHTASRVCCTPLPVMGFARFPAGPTLLAQARSDAPPSVASLPLRSSFPIEAGGLSPGSPASSPLVRRHRSVCFPRPRGLAPLSGPTPPGVTAEPSPQPSDRGASHEANRSPQRDRASSSLGVPSTQAFTRAPIPLGDRETSFRDAPTRGGLAPGAPRTADFSAGRWHPDPPPRRAEGLFSRTAAAVLGAVPSHPGPRGPGEVAPETSTCISHQVASASLQRSPPSRGRGASSAPPTPK
jgi:hypothetical protein